VTEPIQVCNKEDGSFSQLWGRDCWVADSVLKLIHVHADLLYEQSNDPAVGEALRKIMAYCNELRDNNRVYFADTIGVPE
jgi:hypothetical protein